MEMQNLQILIADSSIATNLQLKIQLEKLGCSVITTTNNTFRLMYLIKSLNPNFIIVDTELLNSSIEDYLKQSENPILFTTCYGIGERLFELVGRRNTIGYLVKPIDKFSLYSCIQWALKFHTNH